MNPKYSPALSTVPECTLTAGAAKAFEESAGAMSIKQQEQQFLYGALQKVNNKF
jgi:hypothetical protein